jgi:phi13 family phage major tail protein
MIKNLKYPVYALYSDITGVPTYSNGKVMAKAIDVNVTWTKNNVEVHADGDVVESDYSIQYGTETIGVHQLTDAIRAELLGHSIVDGAVVIAENDEAPYVGHGFYAETKIDGETKYRAVWYGKVKYGDPNESARTKGQSTEFQTPTLEGRIVKAVNGRFCETKTFETEAEAVAYLNGKAGIVPQLKKPVASVPSGTYSDTQSVTLTTSDDADIYYTTNGTTPSATNGTKATGAVSISATCALRAIAIKSGYSNSEVATYEYIIEE